VVEEQRDRQAVIDNALSSLEGELQTLESAEVFRLKDSRIHEESFVKQLSDLKTATEAGREANIQERFVMNLVTGRLLDLKSALDENTAGDESLSRAVGHIQDFLARKRLKPEKKKKKKKKKTKTKRNSVSEEDQVALRSVQNKMQQLQELEAKFEAKLKLQAETLERNATVLKEQERKMKVETESLEMSAKESEEIASALKARLGLARSSISEIKEVFIEKRRASMHATGSLASIFIKKVPKRRFTLGNAEEESEIRAQIEEEPEMKEKPAAIFKEHVADLLPKDTLSKEKDSAISEEHVADLLPKDTLSKEEETPDGAQADDNVGREEANDEEEGGADDNTPEQDIDVHHILATMPLLESDGDEEVRRLQKELRLHNEERELQEKVAEARREDYYDRRRQSIAQSEKLRSDLEAEQLRIQKARRASTMAVAFLEKHDMMPAETEPMAMADADMQANDLEAKTLYPYEGVNPDGTWDQQNPPAFLLPTLAQLTEAEDHQREERSFSQEVEGSIHRLAAHWGVIAEQGRRFDAALDEVESLMLALEARKADVTHVQEVQMRVDALERARNERDATGSISKDELRVRLPALERAVADLRVKNVLEQQVQALMFSKGDANVLKAQMAGLSASVRTLVDDARQQDRHGIDRALRTTAARQDNATFAFDSFAASFDTSTSRLSDHIRSLLSEAAAPKLIRKLRTQTANTVEAAVAAQAGKLARLGKSLSGLQENFHRMPDEKVVRRIVAVNMDSTLKAKDVDIAKLSGLLHQLSEEQRETLTRDEALVLATARVDQIFDSGLGIFRLGTANTRLPGASGIRNLTAANNGEMTEVTEN